MRKLNLSKSEANKSPQKLKSFLAMLVLALGLFLGMLEEGKAQPGGACPSGYDTKSNTVDIGGCTITYYVCVKCDPSGYLDNSIIVNGWEIPTCSPAPSSQQILDAIKVAAKAKYMQFGGGGWCSAYYPPICNADPPDNHYYVTQQVPICWQKIYVSPTKSYVWNCDGAYCQTTWELCYDTYLGLMRSTLYYGPATSGTVTCSSTTEPDDPTQQNPITSCWKLNTGCN